MPRAAPRGCLHPGCRGYAVVRGYCDDHRRDRHAYDLDRGTSHQRGYGADWRKARDGWLREHPTCVHCLRAGRLVPATVVDHIIPHKGNTELFWDETNWQSLCESCHNRKTASEDMGAW